MPDLRPGNRGIGVSVAVDTNCAQRGLLVTRRVLRRILAFDAAESAIIPIQPGAILEFCRIVRNSGDAETSATEVYVMEFDLAGRRLRCPLVDFQARTETSQLIGA